MDDRRVFRRFPVGFSLKFLNLWEGQEGKATTFDVSAKGLGIAVEEDLPVHTRLEMWLKIPDRDEPLYTRGEVAWSNRLNPDKYRIGIKLEKADLSDISKVIGGKRGP